VRRASFPSQKALSIEVGLSRDVVSRFLNGKRIDFVNFHELCQCLSLDWQEIADLTEDNPVEEPQGQGTPRRVDWGDAPEPVNFYGRSQEKETLETWIVQDNCRVIAVTGLARVGKTYLVTKVVREIANEFEFVIWRSSPRQTYYPLQLLKELLQFLTNEQDKLFRI